MRGRYRMPMVAGGGGGGGGGGWEGRGRSGKSPIQNNTDVVLYNFVEFCATFISF